MSEKRFGRREFLKITIATAAAAGLSHFRILNVGGVDVAYARLCEAGDPNDPDTCDATSVDWCIPEGDPGTGDPDECPGTDSAQADMCPDDSSVGAGDYCEPPTDPDVCYPEENEQDICQPVVGDPDVCIGDSGDGDQCDQAYPYDPDVCGLAGESDTSSGAGDPCDPSRNPDTCTLPNDPDVCEQSTSSGNEQDICNQATNNPDVCIGDTGVDPDVCEATGDPDICAPTWDPDESSQPNDVTLNSLEAESILSVLPVLGSVAAALGAAALWLRGLHSGKSKGG